MKTTIAYERKYISITRKELYFTCLNEKKVINLDRMIRRRRLIIENFIL